MSFTAKIDSALATALDAAGAPDEMVEAVVRLHPDAKAGYLEPEVTEARARELLERVQGDVGVDPKAVNVFRNLGSFVVVAAAPFIRALVSQPEVASAVANRQRGSGMIKPVNKRPANLDDVGRKAGSGAGNRPASAPKKSRPK